MMQDPGPNWTGVHSIATFSGKYKTFSNVYFSRLGSKSPIPRHSDDESAKSQEIPTLALWLCLQP
jgi:hypothetical protein